MYRFPSLVTWQQKEEENLQKVLLLPAIRTFIVKHSKIGRPEVQVDRISDIYRKLEESKNPRYISNNDWQLNGSICLYLYPPLPWPILYKFCNFTKKFCTKTFSECTKPVVHDWERGLVSHSAKRRVFNSTVARLLAHE